ncbi:uncharacterized protein MELLADRAFT_58774 [Melampsora larici-populina 98AG31]|uniref:Zn(2)-C6 fungal-type domain-containing protein n=1 Tax=Melampsora larici-populina (strain 98AG31 / pathotype 3-4-7) TaxID=747676 RepID=F4R4T3_MELLP|nr:uncharacterized protein MELLADRAFT_58774 [Melampsora larici-populina 98AG31]EGG12945.1 hypothetical protein MELLADRAFT_58774 [Melampsora larici-populina 98AG31]
MTIEVPIPCSRCYETDQECTWEDLKNDKLNTKRLRACDHCRSTKRSCDGVRPDWATALSFEEKHKYSHFEPYSYDTKPSDSSLASPPISSNSSTSVFPTSSSLPSKLASTPSSKPALPLFESPGKLSTPNSCQIMSGGMRITVDSITDSCQIEAAGTNFKIEVIEQSP